MDSFEQPILFIIFNKLDTTKRVFEQIKKIKPLKLYVASDGPRNEAEKEKVEQVRLFILSNTDWKCEIKTRFRNENLGVGFGPNDAITWFFSEETSGIILEDDCLPSISFFKYCSELLETFKENKNIGVIQGFNPFPELNLQESYFFSKYDLKWGGWATWRDRWQYQDMYSKEWPKAKRTSFLDKLSKKRIVKCYWETIFEQIYMNPFLAWDTQFTFQMLKRNLLTIVPKRNIIMNIGYGPEASSTKWGIPEHIANLKLEDIDIPLVHTEEFKVNEKYDGLVESIHFKMDISTVFRLKFQNFLYANLLTRKTVLPLLVSLYRVYKKFKLNMRYGGPLV